MNDNRRLNRDPFYDDQPVSGTWQPCRPCPPSAPCWGDPCQEAEPGRPPQRPWPGRPPQEPWPGRPPQGPWPGRPPQGSWPGRPPQGPWPGRPPQGSWPGRPPQGPWPGRPPQGPGPVRPRRSMMGGTEAFNDVKEMERETASEMPPEWQLQPGSETPPAWQMPPEGERPVADDLYMTDEPERERMEQDWLYMKQLYPNEARKLQRYVDDAADKLEYENSMMFDEYPDRIAVEQLVHGIIEAIQENEPMLLNELFSGEGQAENGQRDERPSEDAAASDQTWPPCVEVLIQVLVLAEMHHRRWRYGQIQRRTY